MLQMVSEPKPTEKDGGRSCVIEARRGQNQATIFLISELEMDNDILKEFRRGTLVSNLKTWALGYIKTWALGYVKP